MITRRFKRLAERVGLPLIVLHDVRHGYATAGRNAKIDGPWHRWLSGLTAGSEC
jgi:hypothetical protein